MISFRRWVISGFLKLYVAAALVIAAVLSPVALSFIPVLLLVWYLYLYWRPISATISLLTEYFMFFALALLFALPVGAIFSLFIALPVLLLVNQGLEKVAGLSTSEATKYRRSPTRVCRALVWIAVLALGVGGMVNNLSLILACAVMLAYFLILGIVILRRLPLKPVLENPLQHRMVAGARGSIDIDLAVNTKVGGLLFLESPDEWLTVSPDVLPLKGKKLLTRISLTPALSGPTTVKLRAYATDRWGLMQVKFELEPVSLYVIPRARYADWLAKRYLSETKGGILPLVSEIESLRSTYGLRSGIEYYGSRVYQPGDSLKNIDWKHSLKHNELISKEFAAFHGQSAVILINLAAGNEEDADKLAYKIIVAAISLAQENIPAALAVYHHEGVRLTTTTLQPRELLLQSLRVAREIVTFASPVKYLNPPDVNRVRASISRLRLVGGKAAGVLNQLLQLEYQNLDRNARQNPATRALAEVFGKVDKQSSIVVISQRNHDAEAIAFNTFSYARRGNTIISV